MRYTFEAAPLCASLSSSTVKPVSCRRSIYQSFESPGSCKDKPLATSMLRKVEHLLEVRQGAAGHNPHAMFFRCMCICNRPDASREKLCLAQIASADS